MKKTARVAGSLYLFVAITGAFSMMIVPEALFVPGDAAATAAKIASSELLFRAGIVSGLLCQVTFIFLALALYRLLKDVDQTYATLMVALVMAAVPVAFLNMLNQIAALILATTEQPAGLVLFFLTLHEHGVTAVKLFWGLWLFPFGVLVIRSTFLPRVLGYLLIAACVAYAADSLTSLLFPRFKDVLATFTGVAGGLGEFAIMLWLLIKGVRTAPRS